MAVKPCLGLFLFLLCSLGIYFNNLIKQILLDILPIQVSLFKAISVLPNHLSYFPEYILLSVITDNFTEEFQSMHYFSYKISPL